MKIIGFSGSRTLTQVDAKFLEKTKGVVVVHGGARGIDTTVDKLAVAQNEGIGRIVIKNSKIIEMGITNFVNALKEKGIPIIVVVKPDDPSNKYDYIKRDQTIVDLCDEMYFEWDGKSPGTKATMGMWKKKQKKLKEANQLRWEI